MLFTPINTTHGLSDNQIRYIVQLTDGRMVFTTSGNVNIYNGAYFNYIHRGAEHVYPLSKYDGFYRIYEQGDSLLWIKEQFKLFCINLAEEKYKTDLALYFTQRGINTAINDLFVDDRNQMWLLTSDGLLQTEQGSIFHIAENQGVLQDVLTQGDSLYLFYHTGEVVCYHIPTQQRLYGTCAYPQWQQAYFNRTSLVVKANDGFYQLRNGSKGGCFFFNPHTKTWKTLLETDYTLNTLIVNKQEMAYISCPNGIWIVNPRNEEKQYLPTLQTTKGESISTEISTLYSDKQGGLWIGTLNRGLLYYHPMRYKFMHYGRNAFHNFSQKELIVERFAQDNEGTIFLKCKNNIYQLHNTNEQGVTLTLAKQVNQQIRLQLTQNTPNIYKDMSYNALCTDSRGWVWAGTSDGLVLFKPQTESQQTFYMNDGLSNNFVHAILEDQQQNIWITTSNGITKIQVDEQDHKIHFVNFNLYDGTLEGEYAQGAIFEASDGRLFFGGIDGFNILFTNELKVLPLPNKPVFTNLSLFGQQVNAGQLYNHKLILPQAAPYTNSIELAYNQNFVTFEFSALNYRNPAQTYYRYQLVGIDADWQEIMVSKKENKMAYNGILQLTYTNLPPGKYTLKVMASDNVPQWNVPITEISVLINAPWWKTKIAYAIYIGLFLILLGASIQLYVWTTKAKLKQKHREDILLLRIKNLIEQCNRYQTEQYKPLVQNTELLTQQTLQDTETENASNENTLFIQQAMELVEKNINNPTYSVEQLSRDLCMERTGLYRKLTAMLDQTPSLFIRNIRLKKAAQLIVEKQITITQIAEKVGFSSASYFGKCFQEMYGCKPSEYAKKHQKST